MTFFITLTTANYLQTLEKLHGVSQDFRPKLDSCYFTLSLAD